MPKMRVRLVRWFVVLVAVSSGASCWAPKPTEVVVYSALDREFSEPILDDFEKTSQLAVLTKFDVESTKTVGLVSAIIHEGNRPRCDVFWNNEILHTLRLQKRGLLESFELPNADKFPSSYRSPSGEWYGFAARARILLINTELVTPEQLPTSVLDLTDVKWNRRVGIAKPLFGTTATHAAVLFAHLGEQSAQNFFRQIHQNAVVLSGNKQVAQAVGRGQLAFGITDTDDAIVEIERGSPVEIVYPDQGSDQWGTLFIPNTLCIVKGSPNPKNARALLEYLLRPEVETRLARGASAQFPLHADVTELPRVHKDGIRWMNVDFDAAAEAWDAAARFLRDEFATGN